MRNSSIPPAKANKRNQRGIALVIVVLFSSALAGFMMLTMLQLRREHLAAQTYQGIRAASDAADAGLEFAVAKVWDQYLQNLGKDLPVLGGFKGYLDKVVGKLTKDLLDGEIKLASGAVIKAVEVERVDSAESTVLKVTSIAEANGRERRAVQLFTIGGQAFEAFDYALMANNMECVMCHTVVDSVERLNNKDSKNFGSFDRVKIGVLEKMNIETVSARSRIAGSIHSRGQVNVVKSNIFSNLLSSLTVTAFKANSIDSSGKTKLRYKKVSMDSGECQDVITKLYG